MSHSFTVPSFLVRHNFVALLSSVDGDLDGFEDVERINYDQQINARVRINGHEGDNTFSVDDNASTTTLDGGIGNDNFKIAQLFQSRRDASAGLAPGDEFETLETTLGFLSNGVSLPLTAFGGEGEDTFQVYSNRAPLRLEGGDDDDSFLVRSFIAVDGTDPQALAEIDSGLGSDSIQYAVNAPVSISGGDGFDSVVVLGTELDDTFYITRDGIFGGG